MELKDRLQITVASFCLFSAYCIYSLSEVLFLGCFFAAVGTYSYTTSYYYYKQRARTIKRLNNHFTEPPKKKAMLTILMILSFACGFVFCGLANDCLEAVFL